MKKAKKIKPTQLKLDLKQECKLLSEEEAELRHQKQESELDDFILKWKNGESQLVNEFQFRRAVQKEASLFINLYRDQSHRLADALKEHVQQDNVISKQQCEQCIEVEEKNAKLFEMLERAEKKNAEKKNQYIESNKYSIRETLSKQVAASKNELNFEQMAEDLNEALFQAKKWKGIAIVLIVILFFSLLK